MALARKTRIRTVLAALAYLVAWVALWHLAYRFDRATGISLWSLPAGLTFAVLLEKGARALPLPIIAAAIAGSWVWPQAHWPYYLALNILTPLGYLVSIQTLRQSRLPRYRQLQWRFNDTRQVGAFLAAAAASALFGALVGVLLLKAAGILPPQAPASLAVVGWWASDFLGIAAFAPLLLVFVAPKVRRFRKRAALRPPRPVQPAHPAAMLEVLAQGLLCIVLLAVLFWIPQHLWREQPDPFVALLVFPVLAWIVATHDIRGAVLSVFLYELGLAIMVGLFGSPELALQYQIVMVAGVSALLIGAFSHEKLSSTALFRDLAELSNDLLWEFDAPGHLRELRGRLAESLKIRDVWLGMNWEDLIVQQDETDAELLAAALQRREPFQQLVLCVRLPGRERLAWTRTSGLPLFDEEGQFVGYRGTTVDISAQKQTEALHKKAEELLQNYDLNLEAKVEAKVEERTRILAEVSLRNWRLANYDQLTSLPNRNLLFEHMRKGLQQARRQWRLLAILLVDLDGFKQVNDSAGHDAGDQLLQQVGVRLQQCVRSTDTAARLGGDEFAIVLQDLETPAAAAAVAQKVIDRLAEPFFLHSGKAAITASVGIALYRPELPANLDLAMNLLRQADEAMYAAKRAGKNHWRFADQLGLE
ncbi:MAG: diguanylate cyclase [Candidatus Competibacteraceae bacterium]|nr:diguanylate cyclase [Candidatus Competibacteraceae bacterium]